MVALHADGVTAATAIDAEAEGGATEGAPHYDLWDEPDVMGQADEADDDDVGAWSPVARQARRPAEGAGGSNDPLPAPENFDEKLLRLLETLGDSSGGLICEM